VAKKVTTLYINDTSIRLMVARGKRIVKLAGVPLDSGMAEVSDKVKEAELAAKVKQLLKDSKVRAKKVVVGLSGLHCLSRPVILPELPKAMLAEAVMREAQRVLPVPAEQLYISWHVISSGGGRTLAFMVAIPRQVADTLLGVLHKVGLKPYLMDIKPLALARVVREATAIVLDVQAKEFDLVILSEGIPQPIRTVPFPEETLSLEDKLPIVREELKRTIQFFNTNNPEKPIQPDVKMFVSGELVDEPALYEFLADDTGYQVSPLVSPIKCAKQLDPSHYMVNIGLTLKEWRGEAGPLLANLNTLPLPYQPRPISITRLVAVPAASAAIGLVVMVAMTIQDVSANIDSVQNRLDNANSIIELRQSQNKELTEGVAALEAELADTQAARNRFVVALESLNRAGEVINGDLEATVGSLVDGVDLGSISYSSGGLNLSGQAPSDLEVLEYVRNLDATGRFGEITISTTQCLHSQND
jgi:type IV pilus assembly protein PilM